MKKYFTALEAQQLGGKVLVTVATKEGGFKRGSVAKDCIVVAIDAMKRFPLDATLQSYACLLMGWACFARPMVAKEARNLGSLKLVDAAWTLFGGIDSAFAGNAQWARSQIDTQNYVDGQNQSNNRMYTDLKKHKERLVKKAGKQYQQQLDDIAENAVVAAADFQVRYAKEKERLRQLGVTEETTNRGRSGRGGGRGGKGRGRGGRGGRGRGRGGRGRSRSNGRSKSPAKARGKSPSKGKA